MILGFRDSLKKKKSENDEETRYTTTKVIHELVEKCVLYKVEGYLEDHIQ